MALLDSFQCLCKALVIVVYLRWPFGVGGFRVVSFLDRYPKAASTEPISEATYPAIEVFLTG